MEKRSIQTTYYGPTVGEGENAYKPITKVTYGSNHMEVVANIARNMMANKYGAIVAEAHDEEYGELLCVATMFIGEDFRVAFKRDATRPVLITDLPESGEPA